MPMAGRTSKSGEHSQKAEMQSGDLRAPEHERLAVRAAKFDENH